MKEVLGFPISQDRKLRSPSQGNTLIGARVRALCVSHQPAARGSHSAGNAHSASHPTSRTLPHAPGMFHDLQFPEEDLRPHSWPCPPCCGPLLQSDLMLSLSASPRLQSSRRRVRFPFISALPCPGKGLHQVSKRECLWKEKRKGGLSELVLFHPSHRFF